jgi:predicted permease
MFSDFKFAFRTLTKTPGFTIAAVTVLALGIGANTAVFSVVNALLFAPPTYAQPETIVQVFSQDTKNPKSFRPFSYPTFQDIRAKNSVFSDAMAFNLAMVGISEKDDTRRVFGTLASSNYFTVLGVQPVLGRGFLPAEETPGSGSTVVVVSHNFWKKHGSDPAYVGSKLTVNGRPYTVVGVMPEGFTGTMNLFSCEVWLPLGVFDEVSNLFNENKHSALTDRANTQLLVVGRLKPGLTPATATPAIKTLASNLEQAYPVEQKNQTLLLEHLSRFGTSDRPQGNGQIAVLGSLLLGMAGVVLLVACLNLANMLLARGTSRRKEIAVRLALGASRWRILRQLLSEGFLLSLMGGVVGLVIALWSADLLVGSLSRHMPIDLVLKTGPSPVLLGATLVFCVIGTVAFGLIPALKLSRGDVLMDLKEHAGEDTVRRRWRWLPRYPLVVAQIALSLALLTAATLFIRGAGKAANVDTGLKTTRNYLLEVDATLGGRTEEQSRELYRTLEAKLAALPGVESASISSTVPFGMMSYDRSVQRAGRRPGPDDKPTTAAEGLAFNAYLNSIGTEYFRTVGLPLLRGRGFTVAEVNSDKAPAVAIIDEALAKKLWPAGDALGQRIQYAKPTAPVAKGGGSKGVKISSDETPAVKTDETIEIIGIVPTTRTALFLQDEVGTALYLPFAQGFQGNVFFHVKFSSLAPGQEMAASDLIRRTVREVDSTMPIISLRTFAQHLDANIALWMVRAGAAMFSVFGGLALGLAVVGVYGVKAYAVARRTREIGIRMALGAEPSAVLWMILREGALMLATGIGIGLLLAVGTGKILSGLLYEVGALDPVAFTVAPVVLAAAALLACYLPARRATKVDPMTALRAE